MTLEPLVVPAFAVAIAEIGDKTQLLAIVLATRFGRPVPIIAGILVATLANHAVAAWLGSTVAAWLEGRTFQLIVGGAFLAMAAWALVPDKEDESAAARSIGGVFLTTVAAFFIVEIGDKTQIATSLLAARYQEVLLVTVGTTLGMMAANVPAVLLGEAATRVVPLHVVRIAAAAILAALGVVVIVRALLG